MQDHIQVLVPQKSPNDNRQFRAIVLKNKLKVLLVHDSTLAKSACSISVGVGSLEDPQTSLGLAHFLQHMLFMGSQKFPSPNGYSEFISLNSGMDNAYTSDVQTNYFFEIANKNFEEATERLSEFITSALLDKECIQKERKAVHEEYVLWSNGDNTRKWQVLRKLARQPFHHFSIGNNETLGHQKIREQLVEFYQKHYSANIINAVLASSLSLDEMQKTLLPFLEKIKDKEHPGFKYQEFYKPEDLGKLVLMQSIKDETIMEFFWFMPNLKPKYKKHIPDYFSHTLGHQGQNSLLSILKKQQFASGLSSYTEYYPSQTLLAVQIKLSQKGYESYKQVYNIVIDYTSSLKALDFIYEEIKQLANINFQFMEKKQTFRQVTHFSKNMHKFPLQEILNFKSLYDKYDQNDINDILRKLNPEHLIVILSNASQLTGQQTITEKYLGAKYQVRPLPQRKNSQIIFHDLKPNDFLPLNTKVLSKESPQLPKKLQNNLYHFQEQSFKMCKGGIQMVISSGQSIAFQQLYCTFFNFITKNITYNAQALDVEIQQQMKDNLNIKMFGYSDTIKKLIKKLGEELWTCHKHPQSKQLFEIAKEDYLEQLHNFYSEQTDEIAQHTFNILMKQPRVSIQQMIKEAQDFQFQDFVKRAVKLWRNSVITWIISGNFTEQEAIAIKNSFQKELGEVKPETPPTNNILKLSEKCIKHLVEVQSQQISTSCAKIYFQAGQYNQKLNYILQIIKNHVNEPFFDTLRTKKQLAYALWTVIQFARGFLGLSFVLISSTKDPQYISEQIHDFLKQFFGKLEADLTDEKLKQLKQSIKTKFLAPHPNMKKQFQFIVKQVKRKTYYFNRKSEAQIDKQLERISKADILKTVSKMMQRCLQVLVVSKNHLEQFQKHQLLTSDLQTIKRKSFYYEDNFCNAEFMIKNDSE